MEGINFLGHKRAMPASSALDAPTWMPRQVERPAAVTIAGRSKDVVPAIKRRTCGCLIADELVAEAERFIAHGFKAMKMRSVRPNPKAESRREGTSAMPSSHIKLMAYALNGLK